MSGGNAIGNLASGSIVGRLSDGNGPDAEVNPRPFERA
jgi:hypothetical protein